MWGSADKDSMSCGGSSCSIISPRPTSCNSITPPIPELRGQNMSPIERGLQSPYEEPSAPQRPFSGIPSVPQDTQPPSMFQAPVYPQPPAITLNKPHDSAPPLVLNPADDSDTITISKKQLAELIAKEMAIAPRPPVPFTVDTAAGAAAETVVATPPSVVVPNIPPRFLPANVPKVDNIMDPEVMMNQKMNRGPTAYSGSNGVIVGSPGLPPPATRGPRYVIVPVRNVDPTTGLGVNNAFSKAQVVAAQQERKPDDIHRSFIKSVPATRPVEPPPPAQYMTSTTSGVVKPLAADTLLITGNGGGVPDVAARRTSVLRNLQMSENDRMQSRGEKRVLCTDENNVGEPLNKQICLASRNPGGQGGGYVVGGDGSSASAIRGNMNVQSQFLGNNNGLNNKKDDERIMFEDLQGVLSLPVSPCTANMLSM
eukprot:TRINITY_DN6007_c0_g1_i4.p1 TRINITY_DN6007_c0_g1~~TRINITY_DN6007_c0_g1_i4.p1  ORF type:complete len:481 (-),score=108.62 TRINITY_DN6007_c0_g1_i4:106-1383(-)